MNDELIYIVKKKVDILMEKINPVDSLKEPGVTENGIYTDKIRYVELGGWTHSFFLGMVARMYEYFGEQKYIDYLKMEKSHYWNYLVGENARIEHDAGFLFSLYAVALYKLTGDKEMRLMALKAADEVGKRYQFQCGVITAFRSVYEGETEDDLVHIIPDDMMNICILMWAYGETKHTFYREVFENHITNALRYLVREDFSVRHGYYFEKSTGKPLCETNHCGYAIGSHWARGTAWVIFGLTKAIEFTGERDRYLPILIGVVEKYLAETKGMLIPNWDFRIPGGSDGIIDTSAAAIIACAFENMRNISPSHSLFEKCVAYADKIFNELLQYLAAEGAENIIDKAQCGNKQAGSLWGDYFFVELLMRKSGQKYTDFWT